MKRILITLLAFIAGVPLSAQFIIGWSGGYAPNRELNREIYVYNAINRHNLSKEMGEVHWYQGPVVGIRVPMSSTAYVELLYNRKRIKVSSEFDSSGVTMARELKTLVNTFNLGFGIGNENWTFGCSVDFGRDKGFGKRGVAENIGDQAWQRLWLVEQYRILGISNRLVLTETIFVERHLGFINIRLFAQLPGISSETDRLDAWLFGADLNYAKAQVHRPFNVGAMITVSIGKD